MAWRAGIEARPKLKGNMGANAEEIMKCRLGNFTRAGAWPEAARPDVAVVTRRRQRIARESCRPGARQRHRGSRLSPKRRVLISGGHAAGGKSPARAAGREPGILTLGSRVGFC